MNNTSISLQRIEENKQSIVNVRLNNTNARNNNFSSLIEAEETLLASSEAELLASNAGGAEEINGDTPFWEKRGFKDELTFYRRRGFGGLVDQIEYHNERISGLQKMLDSGQGNADYLEAEIAKSKEALKLSTETVRKQYKTDLEDGAISVAKSIYSQTEDQMNAWYIPLAMNHGVDTFGNKIDTKDHNQLKDTISKQVALAYELNQIVLEEIKEGDYTVDDMGQMILNEDTRNLIKEKREERLASIDKETESGNSTATDSDNKSESTDAYSLYRQIWSQYLKEHEEKEEEENLALAA